MFECGSNPQESVHTEFRSGSVQNAFEGYIANNGVFIHREHKGEHACVGDGDVDSVRLVLVGEPAWCGVADVYIL